MTRLGETEDPAPAVPVAAMQAAPAMPAVPAVLGEGVERAARARRILYNAAWLKRALLRAPQRPSELSKASWWGAFSRTVKEFFGDELTDRAAALTYYSIQSLFPGLLVFVSALGLLGPVTTNSVLNNIDRLAPGPVRTIMTDTVTSLQVHHTTAGALAIAGLLIAFWSASSYIAAFMRAANAIYDVPEGRPIWKTLPIRIAITALTGTLLAASALTVVFTGRLAELGGGLIGVGPQAVRVWDVAKWPVLVIAVGLLFALLYWTAPNARHGGFRWVTPGSALALVLWLVVSLGFAFYVSRFATYNKTYGTIGGVIIFLIWLWLSNVALLLGAEFDAELSRSRAIEGGYPRDAEPYVQMRQTPKPVTRAAALAIGAAVPPDAGPDAATPPEATAPHDGAVPADGPGRPDAGVAAGG